MVALTAIKNHVMNFDEADYILREALFTYFLGLEQFKEAAQTLSMVNLESFSDHDKVDIYVKCAGKITVVTTLCE